MLLLGPSQVDVQAITQQVKLAKLAQQVIPVTALLDKRPTYALAPVSVPERKVRIVCPFLAWAAWRCCCGE
jgi:hypothetical protein